MPARRKATGNQGKYGRRLPLTVVDNWPDTGGAPGPKGCPRGSGEPAKGSTVMAPELKDMLGAAAAGVVGVVNGPEDEVPDWPAVNWRAVEDDVRRLRQRIFAASQAGDLKKVRNLQRLMLR